jgi:hypothetical protein
MGPIPVPAAATPAMAAAWATQPFAFSAALLGLSGYTAAVARHSAHLRAAAQSWPGGPCV